MTNRSYTYPYKSLLPAAVFGITFVLGGLFFSQRVMDTLQHVNGLILQTFSTYYLAFGFLIVLLSLLLAFLPLGRKRLGNEKPEYPAFSWIALLYSTGMGSGLLLRAVQEPVYYYTHPPVSGIDPEQLALQYTFFHWGITPWALYSIFGLVVAWHLYIRKESSIAKAVLPEGAGKTWISLTYVFITFITLAGVVASLGLGAGQFVGGINAVFGWEWNHVALLLTVLGIGIISTLSALTGIKKVIRYLADFDLSVSILLLLFVSLFLGDTSFFSNTARAFGNYVLHFAEMSLSAGNYDPGRAFTNGWTVFYWAFWISWVPFTGIFIARISRGRTIREFLLATIVVPALASILWFAVLGTKAIDSIKDAGAYTGEYDHIFTSIYHFLQRLPFPGITVIVVAMLVLVAIINSVDSAIFVLSIFSDKGNPDPQGGHKLIWGAIITATALGLTALGSDAMLNAVSNLLIILALPFSFFYAWLLFLFFRRRWLEKTKASK